MNAQPSPSSPGVFGRPILTVTIVLAVLAALGLGGVALANRGNSTPSSQWQAGTPAPKSSTKPPALPADDGEAEENEEKGAISLSATGDIIMGSSPNRLPARGGGGVVPNVGPPHERGQVMGNLEQPLTGDTGSSKCGSPPRANCFAFRAPPAYAKHLKAAGFQLLNTANNHSNDFGRAGYRNTAEALEAAGLEHTGAADQITIVEVKGVKVAAVGFSSYAGANNLNDLDAAREVVTEAAEKADLVVVQVHMGAEGSDKGHVRAGSELYFGENRGDPKAFSRAVIDAGADVVVGHGPHVLRGMEFYKDRLIAYSLGNFAGGGKTLKSDGVLKYGAILHVSLRPDGTWAGGKVVSTYMNPVGVPTADDSGKSRDLIAGLSADDFGKTAAKIGDDGSISPPG